MCIHVRVCMVAGDAIASDAAASTVAAVYTRYYGEEKYIVRNKKKTKTSPTPLGPLVVSPFELAPFLSARLVITVIFYDDKNNYNNNNYYYYHYSLGRHGSRPCIIIYIILWTFFSQSKMALFLLAVFGIYRLNF